MAGEDTAPDPSTTCKVCRILDCFQKAWCPWGAGRAWNFDWHSAFAGEWVRKSLPGSSNSSAKYAPATSWSSTKHSDNSNTWRGSKPHHVGHDRSSAGPTPPTHAETPAVSVAASTPPAAPTSNAFTPSSTFPVSTPDFTPARPHSNFTSETSPNTQCGTPSFPQTNYPHTDSFGPTRPWIFTAANCLPSKCSTSTSLPFQQAGNSTYFK